MPGGEDYGLAWWASPANLIFVPGDYNADQVVNAEDYNVWSANYGAWVSPGTGADGNGNGFVDAADYAIWRKQSTAGSGTGVASVPEPSAICFAWVGVLIVGAKRRKVACDSVF